MPSSNTVARIMPYNEDAEKMIVSAIVHDPDSINKIPELKPEDFFTKGCRTIFSVITGMISRGEPIDAVSLVDRVSASINISDIGGTDSVYDICNYSGTSANIMFHANIVKQYSQIRQLVKASEEIQNFCFTQGRQVSTNELMSKAEQLIFSVTADKSSESSMRDGRQIVVQTMNGIDRIAEASKNKGFLGIPTGFFDLDYVTNGLQNSQFIILAARPSMGKTALANNIAMNAVAKDKKVGIFSLEMSTEQVGLRILSSESNVPLSSIMRNSQSAEEMDAMMDAMNRVYDSGLFMDDNSLLTPQMLASKARKLKMEHGLDLIIVDYIQLMQSVSRRGNSDNRQQEISEISRSMKNLARELNIPVLGLSQLNRGVENRSDKRPMLADLRESGSLEQDADIIMFLYRDGYYNQDSPNPNITELIVAKNRFGKTTTVNLYFNSDTVKFLSLAHDDSPPIC